VGCEVIHVIFLKDARCSACIAYPQVPAGANLDIRDSYQTPPLSRKGDSFGQDVAGPHWCSSAVTGWRPEPFVCVDVL
jgi:hypothetical protein